MPAGTIMGFLLSEDVVSPTPSRRVARNSSPLWPEMVIGKCGEVAYMVFRFISDAHRMSISTMFQVPQCVLCRPK